MLSSLFGWLCDKIERFLQKGWQYKTILFTLVCIALFSFPDPSKMQTFAATNPIYACLQHQVKAPLTQQHFDAQSHYAKRTFRLLLPLTAKFLSLPIKALPLLQSLLGILFFGLVARFSLRYSDDRVVSFLFTVGMAGLYIGKSFFVDYWLFFDATAFFFLVLALYYAQAWIVFLALTAAFWTDERALIAAIGVLFFHLAIVKIYVKPKPVPWQTLLAIVVAWLCYGALRWYLHAVYGLSIGKEGLGFGWALQHFLKYMPLASTMFLESYWLYIGLALVLLCFKGSRSRKWLALGLLMVVSLQVLVALSVGDMVRSGAYLVVPCLAAFVLFIQLEPSKTAKRKVAFIACLFAFVIPTYSNFGGKLIWLKPDFLLNHW